MKFFKEWLKTELNATANTLKNIPLKSRKGNEVAMYRKRARDAETALQLVAEFEIATSLNGTSPPR